MKRTQLTVCLLLILAVSLTGLAESRWLHVQVESRHKEELNLNVPVALLSSVVPFLEANDLGVGSIQIHRRSRRGSGVDDLRDLWKTVKREGKVDDLAVFEQGDVRARAFTRGRNLVIQGEDGDREEFRVQIPTRVVDALLSGRGNEIDVAAALRELARLKKKDVFLVRSDRKSLKIWIDDSSRGN